MTTPIAAEAINDLVAALRYHGLKVGVDDAFRLAFILAHAGGWSEERRIRALKALVARSDAERAILDEVGPLLIGAPALVRSPVVVELGQVRPRQNGALPLPEVREEIEVPPPDDDRERAERQRQARRRIALSAAAVVALALAIQGGLKVKEWLAEPPELPPALPDAGTRPVPQPDPRPTRPTRAAPDVPVPGLSPAARAWLERGADGLWIVLAGLGLGVMVLEVGRHRRALTRDAKARALAQSTGPRAFSPRRLATEGREPLDRAIVREMAFHLIPAGAEEEAPWLDGVRTVEATARAAGRLELVFGRWQRDRDVIFIEDVADSMQRWPLHARQIAHSLAAQGRQVIHLYMRGEPSRLGTERSLAETQPLDEVLAARPEHAVVILSDAAALDEPERQRRAGAWTSRLGQAIWLHPRPRELWGDGPRFLHGTIPLVALERDELLRVGGLTGVRPLRPRWLPPLPADDDPPAVLASWRLALGADAYLGLASGALLATARCFNTRLFWTMVAEGVVECSWARLDRIWDLPGITVSSAGEVSLAPELRDALVAELRERAPAQAERVARWLARLLAQTAPDSLGGVQASLQVARLYAAAGLRAEERQQVRALRSEGLTELLAPQLSARERDRWRVEVRLRKPSPARLAAGAGALACASILAALIHRQPLLECTFPPATTLHFTDPAHPQYPPGGVVTVRAQRALACPMWVTVSVGGQTREVAPSPDGFWRISLSECCGARGPYELALGVARRNQAVVQIQVGTSQVTLPARESLLVISADDVAGAQALAPRGSVIVYQSDGRPGRGQRRGADDVKLVVRTSAAPPKSGQVLALAPDAAELSAEVFLGEKPDDPAITTRFLPFGAVVAAAGGNSLAPELIWMVARLREGIQKLGGKSGVTSGGLWLDAGGGKVLSLAFPATWLAALNGAPPTIDSSFRPPEVEVRVRQSGGVRYLEPEEIAAFLGRAPALDPARPLLVRIEGPADVRPPALLPTQYVVPFSGRDESLPSSIAAGRAAALASVTRGAWSAVSVDSRLTATVVARASGMALAATLELLDGKGRRWAVQASLPFEEAAGVPSGLPPALAGRLALGVTSIERASGVVQPASGAVTVKGADTIGALPFPQRWWKELREAQPAADPAGLAISVALRGRRAGWLTGDELGALVRERRLPERLLRSPLPQVQQTAPAQTAEPPAETPPVEQRPPVEQPPYEKAAPNAASNRAAVPQLSPLASGEDHVQQLLDKAEPGARRDCLQDKLTRLRALRAEAQRVPSAVRELLEKMLAEAKALAAQADACRDRPPASAN